MICRELTTGWRFPQPGAHSERYDRNLWKYRLSPILFWFWLLCLRYSTMYVHCSLLIPGPPILFTLYTNCNNWRATRKNIICDVFWKVAGITVECRSGVFLCHKLCNDLTDTQQDVVKYYVLFGSMFKSLGSVAGNLCDTDSFFLSFLARFRCLFKLFDLKNSNKNRRPGSLKCIRLECWRDSYL